MTQEPMTLYKLIILYLLDRVNFPMTKAQIDTFILEKEYTGYMNLQQAFGELEESGMISSKTVHNRTQLFITDEGQSTLAFFENNISDAIKEDIRVYLKANSNSLRNEVSVASQYYKTTSGSFEAHLTAKERGELLVDLKLSVPDASTAANLCDNWQQKNQEIYALLMKELIS